MTDHPKYIKYHISSEWGALYVDGKLDYVGDHSNVDERIFELLGGVYGESFVMEEQIEGRDDVPKTLDELAAREAAAEDALCDAQKLRDQAEDMRRQADELERQAGRVKWHDRDLRS